VSTDFLSLRLFGLNICQHSHQILYFKLHVHSIKFHCWRPHAAARPQVVDRWFILCAYYMFEHWNCN